MECQPVASGKFWTFMKKESWSIKIKVSVLRTNNNSSHRIVPLSSKPYMLNFHTYINNEQELCPESSPTHMGAGWLGNTVLVFQSLAR